MPEHVYPPDTAVACDLVVARLASREQLARCSVDRCNGLDILPPSSDAYDILEQLCSCTSRAGGLTRWFRPVTARLDDTEVCGCGLPELSRRVLRLDVLVYDLCWGCSPLSP